MHRVDRDPLAGQAAGPLAGQRDLRALAASVGLHAVVRGRPWIEPGDVEPLGVHPARGDQDHARGCAGLEQRKQCLGEQERSEHLRGERDLVALLGHDVGVRQRACVVDEHVEAVVRPREALGERARLREQREIGELRLDLRARLGGEPRARLLGAPGVPADDADRSALPGEVARCSEAEARRRARDDRHLPSSRSALSGGQW